MVVMLMLIAAARVDAAPGDVDTTFVPVTPCRLEDTRELGGAPLAAGEVRVFEAFGTRGPVVGSQCTIPTDAVGLSMNVTALGASVESFLTIWPDGVPQPFVSSLNPAPGQPPIPNAVATPISSAGRFKVFNNAGSVGMIIDVNGYYTKSSLTELAQKVSALETKLASMTATTVDGHPTVRFTGVNVQIVDGSTDSVCGVTGFENCNGVGNLIVGYNEPGRIAEPRTGSHNIVVGTEHGWTSHSGLVAGFSNVISDEWASVSGGAHNDASGPASSISGGVDGTASGVGSSVSGGSVNTASGKNSSVSGGGYNVASSFDSSVSGGRNNSATTGLAPSVSGGYLNVASGEYASVSGGGTNAASGERASVSGGLENTASGPRSSVSGGKENSATQNQGWASGGFRNSATGVGASALGGSDNTAGPTFNDVTAVGGISKTCNTSTAQLC